MSQKKILYVCECCYDNGEEMCARFDRYDLRVASDGMWMCETCWAESSEPGEWSNQPAPPEYVPKEST